MARKSGEVKSIDVDTLGITILGPVSKNGKRLEKEVFLQNLTSSSYNNQYMQSINYKVFEDLRSIIVGQTVEFEDYRNGEVNGADIFYKGVNVALKYLEKGWLRLEDKITKYSKYYDEYLPLNENAKEKQRGLFSKDLKSELHLPTKSVNNYIKKELSGYIKEINFNMSFTVFVLDCNTEITVEYNHVKIPIVNKAHVEDIKAHMNCYLLQKTFNFVITERDGDCYKINHSNGQFSPLKFLLSEGIAKVLKDEEIGHIDDKYKSTLKEWETVGKASQKFIWKDFVIKNKNTVEAKPTDISKLEVFSVFEVHSGDSITIKSSNNSLKKIFFSNLRAPKLHKNEAFSIEAKDYVRKQLIGEKVAVEFEFKKTTDNGDMEFCTVFFKNLNFSFNVVESGICDIAFSKKEEPSSKYLKEMVELNTIAKAKKVGMFSTKVKTKKYWDYTLPENKKNLLQQLNKNSFDNASYAVVEYMSSAERVKLRVDKEKCYIFLKINNIKILKENKENELLGKYYEKANLYGKSMLLNRDIEFEVHNMDKYGVFHGDIKIKGKQYSKMLLEQGLAYVDPLKSGVKEDFLKAEESAKSKKLNIWAENFDFLVKKEEKEEDIKEEKVSQSEPKKVLISECISIDKIYISEINNKKKTISEIIKNKKNELKKMDTSQIKPKTLGICKFGNEYNRVQIISKKKSTVEVFFVDYGNKDEVKDTDIYSLLEELKNIPPQAKNVKLAYINGTTQNKKKEYELIDLIDEFIGNECFIDIKYTASGVSYALFFKEEGQFELKDSLNYLIVSEGLGYLRKKEMEASEEWEEAVLRGIEVNPDINMDRNKD